jgi:hypothetical protein
MCDATTPPVAPSSPSAAAAAAATTTTAAAAEDDRECIALTRLEKWNLTFCLGAWACTICNTTIGAFGGDNNVVLMQIHCSLSPSRIHYTGPSLLLLSASIVCDVVSELGLGKCTRTIIVRDCLWFATGSWVLPNPVPSQQTTPRVRQRATTWRSLFLEALSQQRF